MQRSSEEQNIKHSITIFGEPVVKTRCQRNALITGITGGIAVGLVTFLFTSQPKKATTMAFGAYFAISFTMTCYCTYEDYDLRKQRREMKEFIYDLNAKKAATEE